MPVPLDPALTSALTYVACFDSGPRGGRGLAALFVTIWAIIKVGLSVKAGDDMIHSAACGRLPARLAFKSR